MLRLRQLALPTLVLLLHAHATPTRADLDPAARVRCAVRLGIAFTGEAPTEALLTAQNPQDLVPGLMQSPLFQERFASFINTTFNEEPDLQEGESPYFLTRYILQNDLPWRDLFAGPYKVERQANQTGQNPLTVVSDPLANGYFSSSGWQFRYRGNDLDNYRLQSAYRILNNTIGLRLTATTSSDDVEETATGRQSAGCRGCHFEGPFALDLVARLLTKRGPQGTYVPPSDGPQTVLGGVTLSDERGLVDALVSSADFRFRACQLAFEFLYGRSEYSCDGPLFDQCMAAFSASGKIQSALDVVARDPGYCE